jgi:hypothetical protein
VGNNIPASFIQDAIKFPDLIHAVKSEPPQARKEINMLRITPMNPTQFGQSHSSTQAVAWLGSGVPQPPPDNEPSPRSPHPTPQPPALPPNITEPSLPGQNEPVREPNEPTNSPLGCRLH